MGWVWKNVGDKARASGGKIIWDVKMWKIWVSEEKEIAGMMGKFNRIKRYGNEKDGWMRMKRKNENDGKIWIRWRDRDMKIKGEWEWREEKKERKKRKEKNWCYGMIIVIEDKKKN